MREWERKLDAMARRRPMRDDTPVRVGDIVLIGWCEVQHVEDDGRLVIEVIDSRGTSVQFLTMPPECVWRVQSVEEH